MSSAAKSSVLLREKLAAASSVDEAFVRDYFGAQRKLLDEIWTFGAGPRPGLRQRRGHRYRPRGARSWLYKAAWPVFNFISATTREDAVVGQHFADVFNLDESVTTMIKARACLPDSPGSG